MEQSNQIIHMDKKQTLMFKGMAILMVVVDHIGVFSGLLPHIPLGACGVYIFLFLSGYGLMRSVEDKGLHGYWVKRIKNVYLPYLAVLLLVLILAIVVRDGLNGNIIKYLFLMDYPFGEYWYLRIQVEWYIAFFLIWNMETRLSLNMKWTLLLMSLADILIVTVNASDRKFVWTLGAFVIGGGMAHYGMQILDKLRCVCVTVGFMAVIIAAAFIKKMPWVEAHELGAVDTICQILIVFCAAALIILYAESIVNRIWGMKSILAVAGTYSYEIYLTHSVYIEMLKNVAEKSIGEKLVVILIFIGLTFISTLILRWLMKAIKGKGGKVV